MPEHDCSAEQLLREACCHARERQQDAEARQQGRPPGGEQPTADAHWRAGPERLSAHTTLIPCFRLLVGCRRRKPPCAEESGRSDAVPERPQSLGSALFTRGARVTDCASGPRRRGDGSRSFGLGASGGTRSSQLFQDLCRFQNPGAPDVLYFAKL